MLSSKTNNSSDFARLHWHWTWKITTTLSSKLLLSAFIRFYLNVVHPATSSEKDLSNVLICLEVKSNPIAPCTCISLLLDNPFIIFAFWLFINTMDTIDIIVTDQYFDLFDPRHFFEVFNLNKLAPFGVSASFRSTYLRLFGLIKVKRKHLLWNLNLEKSIVVNSSFWIG